MALPEVTVYSIYDEQMNTNRVKGNEILNFFNFTVELLEIRILKILLSSLVAFCDRYGA